MLVSNAISICILIDVIFASGIGIKNIHFLYTYNISICMLCFRTNPLGMKGHIAKRYGDLVRELWAGNAKSVAPLKLRVRLHG